MEVQYTTWDFLRSLNTTKPLDIVLKRTSKSQEEYEIHKKTINIDINDYLKQKLFGSGDRHQIFNITENSFPYNCEPNIKHMLLWINPNMSPSKEEIDIYIKKKYSNNEIIYFENADKNKSVPGIKHFHLFIKFDCKN